MKSGGIPGSHRHPSEHGRESDLKILQRSIKQLHSNPARYAVPPRKHPRDVAATVPGAWLRQRRVPLVIFLVSVAEEAPCEPGNQNEQDDSVHGGCKAASMPTQEKLPSIIEGVDRAQKAVHSRPGPARIPEIDRIATVRQNAVTHTPTARGNVERPAPVASVIGRGCRFFLRMFSLQPDSRNGGNAKRQPVRMYIPGAISSQAPPFIAFRRHRAKFLIRRLFLFNINILDYVEKRTTA